MADLLKWCLDNVEYQRVLKGIRRYRVQKYFILKKTWIIDRVLFAFETQCWNSVSGNGCNENTIMCSTTTLLYIYEPFPITSYFHRQCFCLRSDTCDILMHVAIFIQNCVSSFYKYMRQSFLQSNDREACGKKCCFFCSIQMSKLWCVFDIFLD